ncbi:hypothetical protein PG990_002895 [Apiospora arundinis]
MSTNQDNKTPTLSFKVGYCNLESLREYLVEKAKLEEDTDFEIESKGGEVKMFLTKDDPDFEKNHRKLIEKYFKEKNKAQGDKNLGGMEEK